MIVKRCLSNFFQLKKSIFCQNFWCTSQISFKQPEIWSVCSPLLFPDVKIDWSSRGHIIFVVRPRYSHCIPLTLSGSLLRLRVEIGQMALIFRLQANLKCFLLEFSWLDSVAIISMKYE